MTVRDFVNSNLRDNVALQSTIQAANVAQTAYNLAADTPIEEIQENPERLRELLNNAHDIYRRAASYRIDARSSTLYTASANVRLVDVDSPSASIVPIPGMEAVIRVDARPERVVVLAVESSRGKPVIAFDAWMKPIIQPEFRDYLVGDQVDVRGVVVERIKRGNARRARKSQDEPVRGGAVEGEMK